MMTLEDIQKRFTNTTEKEHWERLKTLLFSEDKENVVMGMNLLETLDEDTNSRAPWQNSVRDNSTVLSSVSEKPIIPVSDII